MYSLHNFNNYQHFTHLNSSILRPYLFFPELLQNLRHHHLSIVILWYVPLNRKTTSLLKYHDTLSQLRELTIWMFLLINILFLFHVSTIFPHLRILIIICFEVLSLTLHIILFLCIPFPLVFVFVLFCFVLSYFLEAFLHGIGSRVCRNGGCQLVGLAVGRYDGNLAFSLDIPKCQPIYSSSGWSASLKRNPQISSLVSYITTLNNRDHKGQA